jgi:hypothetical protein
MPGNVRISEDKDVKLSKYLQLRRQLRIWNRFFCLFGSVAAAFRLVVILE